MSVVANVAINVDSRDAVGKLRQVQSQSQQTERAIGNLGAAVGKLAAAFGLIQAARFVFVKTAELESQTRSLQVLTGSAEKAGQIIQQLQQLGAVTPFTSTELIDSAKRLQAFGVETEKVVETTRRLADVSGATGAELQGLVTAYGQVQAKGRLQGEELLQFQERGVALQQELRKQYGLSGEEFQKALEKGRISAEAVEFAIRKLTDAGGKYANGAIAQSDTLSGRLSTLQDGIEGLARSIGTALSPIIKAVLNEAIFAVNAINQLIATGARAKSFGLGGAQRKDIFNQAQQEAAALVNGRRIKDPFERNRQFQEIAAQRERDLIEAYGIRTGQVKPQATTPSAGAGAPPALLAPTGGGGAKPKGKSDADKAAELAAKQAEQLMGAKMQLELARKIFSIENRILEARFAGNKPLELARNTQKELAQIAGEAAIIKADKDMPIAQKLVELEKLKVKSAEAARSLSIEIAQIEFDRNKTFEQTIIDLDNELKLKAATTEQEREQLRIAQEMARLKGQGFTPEQLAAIQQRKTQLAAPKTDAQKVEERVSQLKKEIADLTNIGNIAIKVADGIGIAFGEAFQGLISGSMSAQEALSAFFKSVGDMFIQMATEIIAKQMTMIILQTILKALGAVSGGGGGGGNYSGAFSSTPGTSFADALKMPSLRAGGGPAAGGTPYLVGERGPELFVPGTSGGVMSNNDLRQSMNGGGSPVLNMSFETTRFGDTEYVSRDQLEAAMSETRRQASRDGAQRGMTMTLDRLQQSPRTRSRLGMR